MSPKDKIERLNKLLSLTNSSENEEARTAALLACKMINEGGMIIVAPEVHERLKQIEYNERVHREYTTNLERAIVNEREERKNEKFHRAISYGLGLILMCAIVLLAVLFAISPLMMQYP